MFTAFNPDFSALRMASVRRAWRALETAFLTGVTTLLFCGPSTRDGGHDLLRGHELGRYLIRAYEFSDAEFLP